MPLATVVAFWMEGSWVDAPVVPIRYQEGNVATSAQSGSLTAGKQDGSLTAGKQEGNIQ
jgi:hypothetical protein